MAWSYRDRVTKRFIGSSTYKRSKAHGGTRFERVSLAHPLKGTRSAPRKTSGKKASHPKDDATPESKSKPGSAPKTFREFQEALKAKQKAKLKQSDRYDDYDTGPEYETGVDY